MPKKQAVQERDIINAALLNVITPMGLEFTKNSLSVGENLGKIYGLIRYPQKVETEWLSKITNIPSTIASIGFKPVDNATLINAISRSVVCRRAESIISVLKCKMRVIPNLQKECFQHISPSFPTNGKIESILQKIVPLSTFVGGFPFASSSISLSKYRIFRISGSSISSTRTPQTVPVIFPQLGFIRGASRKKVP